MATEQYVDPTSGTGTADATGALINENRAVNGYVRISVPQSEANGIEVIASGSTEDDTDGDILGPGDSRVYYGLNLNNFFIKRSGASDAAYTYFAH